ncbi:MerC domain-containing protein [Paraglaciecola agarilytica]|uniref:MerC domain-containing protein n=1 Tax=Paraglaciecola chathamensis TaxID=368405 RepID=A0ABS0WIC9_9ALTE|nr:MULTISPECIES: MerC domain-containing protein [Paraglaciecola]MBJ2138236.1 MerC domain-containing protein [Paraglaciecola chathamensis]MBU3018661.1 MerC domain-containing protein [Paraglaciecola agarilytica]MDO6559939.1 MerC domain-containing protein [Paraglaciecola chathamensis]
MTKLQHVSDKAAVGLSLLCMVHCLFLPIVLVLLPPLSGALAFNDELFHRWMLYAVVPISSAALFIGYFHHRSNKVLTICLTGLGLLIAATLLGHNVLGKYGEVILTVIGSSIIAYGHLLNYHLRRQCNQADTLKQD